METIKINTPFIKLDQLLKFAGIVYSGGDAKELILNGQVTLDGQVVKERGKKIYPGHQVVIQDGEQKVTLQVE